MIFRSLKTKPTAKAEESKCVSLKEYKEVHVENLHISSTKNSSEIEKSPKVKTNLKQNDTDGTANLTEQINIL